MWYNLGMETDLYGLENFFYNRSSVILDSAQVEFIRLNTFYNLNITEITDHNLPVIYEEMDKYKAMYDKLGIRPMVEFIAKLQVKLQPFIDWDSVDLQALQEIYSRKS